MLSLVLAATLLQTPAGSAVAISSPAAVLELDMGKLKGEPWRLAWSPDGSELYLQMVERDGRGNLKSAKHYVIAAAGGSLKNVDAEPAWAARYWSWKAARTSPGAPSFAIDVEQRQETVRATSAPNGGEMAKGGTPDATAGTTVADVNSAASQSQNQTIYELRVKGESIGKWVNEAVSPGLNWSWAPKPSRLIIVAKRGGGGLVFVNDQGVRTDVPGIKGALLPAFSDDGSRLAWLSRKDKKHFDVTVAAVSGR